MTELTQQVAELHKEEPYHRVTQTILLIVFNIQLIFKY